MATTVTYNGITLYNVVTRRFEQEIVYDQSETDTIGSKFNLSFEGILHAQRVPLTSSTAYIAQTGTNSGGTPAAVYSAVKVLLSKPRKPLIVQFGGQTVLSVGPAVVKGDLVSSPLDPDVNNGPKPRRVSIEHVSGNSVYRVRFDIECTIGMCSSGHSNLVLNNRWKLTETMDANFFTTRRIEGRLRAAGPIPGHATKSLVVPGLEHGFRRDSVEFTVEENGLDCTYSITDRQVHTAAPWPATKMEARHSESTNDGVSFISQVNVRLEGPPHVDKRLLIERATQIADNRLDFINQSNSASKEPTMLIEYAEVIDYIGEQAVVELTLRVKQLRDAGELLTHVREEVLGTPLKLSPLQNQGDDIAGTEYDPRLSPYPALYGYDPHGSERRPTVLLLLHCYLQDPCINVHGIAQGSPTTSTGEENPENERHETEIIEKSPGSIPDEPLDKYSESARKGIYTMSKITAEYTRNDMKVGMPLARVAGQRNQDSATTVVFDLCEPQAFKVIEIDSERTGTPPQLPEPHAVIRDGTLVATRKSKNERWYPPVISPDGRTEIFRVEARYVYILNRPPKDEEQIRIGQHPNLKTVTTFVTPSQSYESQLA